MKNIFITCLSLCLFSTGLLGCQKRDFSETSSAQSTATPTPKPLDKEVSGCILFFNVRGQAFDSKFPRGRRLELDVDYVKEQDEHSRRGRAKIDVNGTSFDIEASFKMTTVERSNSKDGNDRFDKVRSRIEVGVNGLSGVSDEWVHLDRGSYREDVFFPSTDGKKLVHMSWGQPAWDVMDKEKSPFYVFTFCTPKFTERLEQRKDGTIHL